MPRGRRPASPPVAVAHPARPENFRDYTGRVRAHQTWGRAGARKEAKQATRFSFVPDLHVAGQVAGASEQAISVMYSCDRETSIDSELCPRSQLVSE
jgi:hypothetical protein